MSPDERIAAYDEAVQVLNNYTAQEAAKIGNSQASLGLMAERLARPSGTTSGLANYTYDRTLRPTLDSLAASLTTTGYSQGLEKQLYDALTAAKNRYEDAKNKYTVASTTPSTTANNNNGSGWTESMGSPKTGEEDKSEQVAKARSIAGNVRTMQGEKKYYYVIDGMSIPFKVYPGLNGGVETGDMSYNLQGGRNFIQSLLNSGARIFDQTTGAEVTNQLII